MAITEIQTDSHSGNDKHPTANFSSTPTNGNLLACLIGWSESKGDATVTLSGWTRVPSDGDVNQSGVVRLALFYKQAGAGESKTVAPTLSAARQWMIAISEAHNTSPSGWALEMHTHSSGSSASPSTGTTAATTTAIEYEVGGIVSQNQATLSAPTNSFNIIEQVVGSRGSGNVSGALLSRITAATGTASTGGTLDTSRPWVAAVATFYTAVQTITGDATLTGTGSLTASPYYSTPTLVVQAAFGYGPGDPDPVFVDISSYARSCQWQRGRQNELNQTAAGTATVVLNDEDSHFDPNNSPSVDYPATEFAATVLANSPRIWLRLDEASGSFTDSSGLGHTGTAVGGVTYAAPGAVTGNTAIALDGSTGYVTVPDHADLDLGDVFTLACWVKRNTVGADHYLFSKGTNAYGMFITANVGVVQLAKTNSHALRNSSVNITADGLYHRVVAVKNGSSRRDIYIDGVLRNGADFGDATCADTSAALNIGREVSTNTSFAACSIDEPAIYASAFTDEQVAADYHAARGGSPFWPNVKPGLPVRAILFVGSSVYPLFYGFAERIPRTSRVTDVYTQRNLELIDGFAITANAGLGGYTYAQEESDVRVNNVLDDIGWPSSKRAIGVGVSPLQEAVFAADDDTRAQSHLQAVNDSENGFLFCDGAGVLVFVGRHELISNPAYTVAQATFID